LDEVGSDQRKGSVSSHGTQSLSRVENGYFNLIYGRKGLKVWEPIWAVVTTASISSGLLDTSIVPRPSSGIMLAQSRLPVSDYVQLMALVTMFLFIPLTVSAPPDFKRVSGPSI
jgi:hypothetical protein